MALPVTHRIILKERIAPVGSLSPTFIAHCDCQWEGLARTLEVAERFVMSHAQAQTLRGNTVIINRELLPTSLPNGKADVAEPQE